MRRSLSDFLIEGHITLYEVMQHFEQNSTGVLFVADTEKRLLGTITDGDIRRALLQGKSLGLSVRVIMNPTPVTLEQGVDIPRGFLQIMAQKGYYPYLPIVDGQNRIVDFASINDVLPAQKAIDSSRLLAGSKVLVVGGAGYIGSTLVRLLLSQGLNVRIFDAMLYGDDAVRDLVEFENFECITGDTRNLKQVYEAVRGVETVVHLGEVVGDPACSLDESYTTTVNHRATESLVKICRDSKVRQFIYVSSCSVYGFGEEVFSETSAPNPVSLYGRTKSECERTILATRTSDFSPTILRLSTVFGWSNRPRFDLVVNYFALEAVTKGRITVSGGSQWRPFVYVKDVARAIQKVINANVDDVCGEIFNVGGDEMNMTIGELGRLVVRVFPGTELVEASEDRDTRNYRVSFEKIKRELDFTPQVSVEEGLRELAERLKEGAGVNNPVQAASNLLVLHPGKPDLP